MTETRSLRERMLSLPRRIERLGGQNTSYVQLDNVLAEIEADAEPSTPAEPQKDEVLKPELWWEVYDWCRDIQKLAQKVSERVDEFANAIPDPKAPLAPTRLEAEK